MHIASQLLVSNIILSTARGMISSQSEVIADLNMVYASLEELEVVTNLEWM